MATKEHSNEASPTKGWPRAPKGDGSATASYIHKMMALQREFDSHSQDASLQPDGEDDISESWTVAWARLRSKPKGEHIYTYDLLQEDGNELRLLALYPGSYLDAIRVSIVHTPFFGSQIPEYEALSYVWGDAMKDLDTVKVIDEHSGIDRGEFEIGQNLSTALRHLRLANGTRTIWCDALCINQKNNDEKSVAILKMGDIYRKAKRVVIWLGPEADKSKVALKTLSHLGKQVDMNWDWSAFGMRTPPRGKDPK
jgi:hypothetical protein